MKHAWALARGIHKTRTPQLHNLRGTSSIGPGILIDCYQTVDIVKGKLLWLPKKMSSAYTQQLMSPTCAMPQLDSVRWRDEALNWSSAAPTSVLAGASLAFTNALPLNCASREDGKTEDMRRPIGAGNELVLSTHRRFWVNAPLLLYRHIDQTFWLTAWLPKRCKHLLNSCHLK